MEGVLYLYDVPTAAAQEVYVDGSNTDTFLIALMSLAPANGFRKGQSIIGYTAGAQRAPTHSESKGSVYGERMT